MLMSKLTSAKNTSHKNSYNFNNDLSSTDADTGKSNNQFINQIKLSDFTQMKSLGSGGFGHVSLVKFKDPDF